jgi:hypothetical protein
MLHESSPIIYNFDNSNDNAEKSFWWKDGGVVMESFDLYQWYVIDSFQFRFSGGCVWSEIG